MARANPAARLFRLSWSNKLVLAEAFVMLAFSSLAIAIVPFRKVVAAASGIGRGARLNPEQQNPVVAQCRWAVLAWARVVPWRAVCFQQGLALHLMLRRRGIPCFLHYGVGRLPEKGLAAHVWLGVGEHIVLGGEVAGDYARLASFPEAEPGL